MTAFRSVALAIAVADLLQVVLLGKGVGAVLGCLLYGGMAVAVVRARWTAWGAVATPLLPTAILCGLLGDGPRLGLGDGPMWMVYAAQLAAGLLAAKVLFRGSAHEL